MLYHPLKSSETSKQKQKKQTKPRRGFAMFVFYGALWIHPLQPHLQVQETYAKPLPSAIDSLSLSLSELFFFSLQNQSIFVCLPVTANGIQDRHSRRRQKLGKKSGIQNDAESHNTSDNESYPPPKKNPGRSCRPWCKRREPKQRWRRPCIHLPFSSSSSSSFPFASSSWPPLLMLSTWKYQISNRTFLPLPLSSTQP